jgi:shikimate dehydrogenase
MPHKEQILDHLNGVDVESGRMRAVNTVYRQNGQWLGTNTDVYGAWKALEGAGAEVQGKRWTILGAGGVARAVACGVVSRGKPSALTVLGRTPKRLDRFLEDLRQVCTCPIRGAILEETDLGEVLDEAEILVNGTPVGMIPEVDRTPIPINLLNSHHLVFDTIYNPVETKLLREAKERGCRTVSGLTMFLHQGAAQFERWTGTKAPFSIMEQKARARLER